MPNPNLAHSMDQTQSQLRVGTFVRSVYNWMAAGLALTGLVAYFVAHTPALFSIAMKGFIFFAIAELILVFTLSARIGKMQPSTATGMFVGYAALNGVTFSYIFVRFTSTSIASTFFICAMMFVALSIYGWSTKKDLSAMGKFMFMGLVGIIIASVVNIFLQSSAMHMIISYIGVIVFSGLTAYDTQTIKQMAMSQPAGTSAGVIRKGAIIGALKLYLDFILMFQFLLTILGGSRD